MAGSKIASQPRAEIGPHGVDFVLIKTQVFV
jgi:hypothetical protein